MAGLLEALRDCTQADLDEIDQKIASLESELGGLKEARRIVAGKLGVLPRRGGARPGRKPVAAASSVAPGGSSASADDGVLTQTEKYRLRVREYIMANGRTTQANIVKDCGIPPGSITNVLEHRWFKKDGKVVDLH